MPRKNNYYRARPASTSDNDRHFRSRDLASDRIEKLAHLRLGQKKAAIRELLLDIGTDVARNDGDPTGDGDQAVISSVEGRDLARHLFATGGDIREHLDEGEVSEFGTSCALGALDVVRKGMDEAKSSASQPRSKNKEITTLLERRETSMRLSPMLLIVSVGKNLCMSANNHVGKFPEIARLLLKNGASPVAKDVVGKTVAHYGAGGMATKMSLEVTDMCIRAAKSHHMYGQQVTLRDLKREEMNGKVGIAGGFDPGNNRRSVYLPEDGREIWIKVENMSLCAEGTCQPYPLLTDIKDRLAGVSLHELVMPAEHPLATVDDTAKFLLEKHNTSIYTEDQDGISPFSMAAGLGQVMGSRGVAKLVLEAATQRARETRKERKKEALMCAKCGVGLSKGRKTLVCSRCKVVPYCGRECQVAHWKEHKKECIDLASLSLGVKLGQPSEFDDGMYAVMGSFRTGGITQADPGAGYKKPRGVSYNEKFVIKTQGNSDMSPIYIYDQSRGCNFYLRPHQKGFGQILREIRNKPAWQGRKTFMKASFDENGICTVYPEKAGVKSHYTW